MSVQGLKGNVFFTHGAVNLLILLPAVFVFFIVLTAIPEAPAQTVINSPRPVTSSTPYMPPSSPMQSNAYSPGTNFAPNNNYLKNSAAFRQEIMRMEISVVRGQQSLPITQVPRVQKDDVIKMKLLDEAVGGIRPDQSMWDWTFLVAFINPNRQMDTGDKKNGAVSEEIQFRKRGWYKEYSFVVPYDSQPVFFLYPKPQYRGKILKVVSRNYNEVRKLGEKTIEIAGAYAQISSFLNELQFVLHQTQQSRYANNNGYGNTYNPYPIYNPYNPYNPNQQNNQRPDTPFNYNAFIEQSIERLARSFNVQLPQCWQSGGSGYSPYNSGGSYGNTYGSYGSYGTTNQNNFGYAVNQELIGRAQCVAKNIKLEDFDFSVASLLQQGGIMVATQLRDKYPQIAYWINIAAAAIDFIVKVFRKSPLRIMPTIVQSSDNNGYSNAYGNNQISYASQSGYMPNSNTAYNQGNNRLTTPGTPPNAPPPPVKISLYAENQPDANQFVTAYPIVVHKWQAEPDPEVISIPPPVLAEPCLHVGVNLLKNTSIGEEPEADTFTKDFKLVMNSSNGFKKEFPLKKNFGLGGWELNLTKEDVNSFPKVQMQVESVITGTRGFNEIQSPPFNLPISLGGAYEVKPESQKAFTVGAKRTVTIRNSIGGCQCLQAVVYKPSFGGQFVFEANAKNPLNQLHFSADGREASFEIDASFFQAGSGQLDVRTFGGESTALNLKLYPLPPDITNFKMARGDSQAVISGERLEQLQSVKINGKRATVVGNNQVMRSGGNVNPVVNQHPGNPSGQPNYPNQNPYQTPNSTPISTATPDQSQNQRPIPIQIPVPTGSPLPAQNNIPQTNQKSFQSGEAISRLNSNSSNVQLSGNERLAVFDDPNARLTDQTISLELGLEDDRSMRVRQTFPAAPSRPAIVVNEQREVEAVAAGSQPVLGSRSNQQPPPPSNFAFKTAPLNSLILPVDTAEISVRVQNALTDYDFKVENIQVETRIEKSQANGGYGTELPKASFEVLDWKNLKVSFKLNEQAQKLLGGRRLQFRIRDKERGDSDWYSIKQTFVRIPEIMSVKCASEMNGTCLMSGNGIDYVAQVSVDGGKSWFPEKTTALQTQPAADGKTAATIPFYTNKHLLQIKLRDFPKTEGLTITNYTFSNLVKGAPSRRVQTQNQNQPVSRPTGGSDLQTNQPPQNLVQSAPKASSNQPQEIKKSNSRKKSKPKP